MKYAKQLKFHIKNIVVGKKYFFRIIFITLFLLSIILRIEVFKQYPYFQPEYPDYGRDYLIAHHIVKYGEIPLTGPQTGEIGTTFGSPMYFYLLAALLKIYESILFLGWVNLFLQIATLLIVFYSAKVVFGRMTALITFALFGLNTHVINQSIFLWQPYIMHPFINLSYLLLLLAYLKKSYRLLLLCIPIFLIAAVLHNSVFAMLPIYIILTLLVIKKHFNYSRFYIGLGTMFIISLSLIYSSRFLYWMQGNPQSLNITSSFGSILNELLNFFNNFFSRTGTFIDSFFDGLQNISPLSSYILGFLIAYSSLFYIYLQKDKSRKQFFAILILCIISFLTFAALMPQASLHDFYLRHFIPIYGLFAIVISELINFYSKKISSSPFVIILVILTLSLSSPNLFQLIKNSTNDIFNLHISYVSDPSILAVKNEILNIKKQNKLPYLNFFQFITYREGYSDEDTFYSLLEIEFNTKLTRIDDVAFRDYSPITNNTYMFVICPYSISLTNHQKECPAIFFQQFPNYSLIKEVYNHYPYRIYITKRN